MIVLPNGLHHGFDVIDLPIGLRHGVNVRHTSLRDEVNVVAPHTGLRHGVDVIVYVVTVTMLIGGYRRKVVPPTYDPSLNSLLAVYFGYTVVNVLCQTRRSPNAKFSLSVLKSHTQIIFGY